MLVFLLGSSINKTLFKLEIISWYNKKNKNVSIDGRVEIGKKAATEISKEIGSVGSNLGFAATIGFGLLWLFVG